MEFNKKKIFILGMAKSGYEAAKLLSKLRCDILLYDDDPAQDEKHIKELEKLKVNIIFEGQPDDIFDKSFDYLVKNPGVPLNHKYVKKAERLKIPVINEVEIAYHLLPKDITLIGITGTNGKTTTTTLVYELLKRADLSVYLTGNIGFPLCSFVGKVKKGDIVVTEISIQQLVNMVDFKTNISVLTNLSEAHIDFVNGYDNYLRLKKKIFNSHTDLDIAILNKKDKTVVDITRDIKSTKKYFAIGQKTVGAYLIDENIFYNEEKIININEIRILGEHNYENILAAIMVVKELGLDNKIIKAFLEDFGGVEHRLEYVGKFKGIEVYNDSKATNIVATQTALKVFKHKKVILILGGLERGQNFFDLLDYMKRVRLIIGYGETKDKIKQLAEQAGIDYVIVEKVEEAVKSSANLANKGDVILFSPACASWDQFKTFEDRGNLFKECIKKYMKE